MGFDLFGVLTIGWYWVAGVNECFVLYIYLNRLVGLIGSVGLVGLVWYLLFVWGEGGVCCVLLGLYLFGRVCFFFLTGCVFNWGVLVS